MNAAIDDPYWVRLAPVERLPRGRAVLVDIDGRPIALFHTTSGLRAVDGSCPHAGGQLSAAPSMR
jgi:nitrite reductase/ring-hydroxylating ferredoxin subunit